MNTAPKARIILGIDPGYADMGYGVIEMSGSSFHYRTCGTITTTKKDTLENRLLLLHTELTKIFLEHRPQLCAIEKLFFFSNQKTAIEVAQARGIALLAAAKHVVPVVEYTPLEIKQSLTSSGNAPKIQVAKMVQAILKCNLAGKNDDAIDAIAIALCAAFRARTALV